MELTREIRDKRIAIAADVIANVMTGRYTTLTGNGYLVPTGVGDKTFSMENIDCDLQPHVDALAANCEVCLLGACLLSKARLFDGVPAGAFFDSRNFLDSPDRSDVTVPLLDIFDDITMKRIESAFEGFSRGFGGQHYDRESSFGHFSSRYADTYEEKGVLRVLAVMQNMITNDGEFNP